MKDKEKKEKERLTRNINYITLDTEKIGIKRDIILKSTQFGVIALTGAFFIAVGDNLFDKLILATPYAMLGGKKLQTIDEERYKLKCINQEIKSLKR